MMKIIALLAFVGVATALPSTDAIVPSSQWDGVDTTLVEVSAFNEAKATVQSMITAGKDEGACADLAAATIKEVEDSVDGQQKMLDSLDTGADCPNKGQDAVDAAQGALDQANKDKEDADAAAATAANADVNFGPKPLSGLTPGNCESFFSDPAYTSAKAAEESAKQAATQAAGAVSTAEAGLKAAQDAQKAAIAECQCAAKKGYEDAWEAANSNNAANEKAYTKGKHMACVLAGTPPADCDVGAIPKVTAITLAAGTQDANCEAPTPAPISEIAAGKPCTMSSPSYGTQGKEAVDGNTATNWGSGSCTHTARVQQPWWRVDLQNRHTVANVKVWNRGDCCGTRLNGFEVRVGDTQDVKGPRCGETHSIGQGKSKKVDCGNKVGRYVTVDMPRKEYLTLCEVKVYGSRA
jgi:hypothetical protein